MVRKDKKRLCREELGISHDEVQNNNNNKRMLPNGKIRLTAFNYIRKKISNNNLSQKKKIEVTLAM